MQVGELFVNIGLMGADKLAKGLETANKSLNQIKETGLESAFKLRNVFGQFEDQVQTFTNFGTVLKVFEDQTGLSAITLQRFQRAFMGVNVSADETRSTMLNLQNIMNTIQRGGAVPAAMSEALRRMNIDVHNIKDIYGFVNKLKDTSKGMDVGIGRDIAKDLGISGTFWQGLRNYTGDFAQEQAWLNKSQITASAQMNAKVNLLRTDIESSFAKLISTPAASKALDAIKNIVMAFIRLLDAVAKFADKSGLLEIIEKFLTAFSDIISAILGIAENFLEKSAEESGKGKENKIMSFLERVDPVSAMLKHFTGKNYMEHMTAGAGILKGIAKETAPHSGMVNNVTVTQNIKSTDPHKAGKESARGVSDVMLDIRSREKK